MSAMSYVHQMTSASRAEASELRAELEEASRTIERLNTERAGLRNALSAQYDHIFALQDQIAQLNARLEAAYTVIRKREPADAPIIHVLTDRAERYLAETETPLGEQYGGE